jgi:hypothetical protein
MASLTADSGGKTGHEVQSDGLKDRRPDRSHAHWGDSMRVVKRQPPRGKIRPIAPELRSL